MNLLSLPALPAILSFMVDKDEWHEADLANDAEGGSLAKHATNAEAIAAQQSHLEYLQRELKAIHPDAVGTEGEFALIREIAQVKQRLAAYQKLEGKRN